MIHASLKKDVGPDRLAGPKAPDSYHNCRLPTLKLHVLFLEVMTLHAPVLSQGIFPTHTIKITHLTSQLHVGSTFNVFSYDA